MWLSSIPPLAVYMLLLFAIGVESMGIPVPGEMALVSASLLAVGGALSPWGVAISAAAGAIVGDSIGYVIGRRGGKALFDRLGRRFPRHLGPDKIERAERIFRRHGLWAVFFGRFIALLRILAGPLAGWLRLPYRKFLFANAGGGILWAGGTTTAVYLAGQAAERYLKNASWILLLVSLAIGALTMLVVRHRARRAMAAETHDKDETDDPAENDADDAAGDDADDPAENDADNTAGNDADDPAGNDAEDTDEALPSTANP